MHALGPLPRDLPLAGHWAALQPHPHHPSPYKRKTLAIFPAPSCCCQVWVGGKLWMTTGATSDVNRDLDYSLALTRILVTGTAYWQETCKPAAGVQVLAKVGVEGGGGLWGYGDLRSTEATGATEEERRAVHCLLLLKGWMGEEGSAGRRVCKPAAGVQVLARVRQGNSWEGVELFCAALLAGRKGGRGTLC